MKLLYLFVTLTCLGGCKTFEEIVTEKAHGQLQFRSEAVAEACEPNTPNLTSIAVTKDDCNSDCVYWELAEKNLDMKLPSVTFPLRYGDSFHPLAELTPAKILTQGDYRVSARFVCEDFGTDAHGRFEWP